MKVVERTLTQLSKYLIAGKVNIRHDLGPYECVCLVLEIKMCIFVFYHSLVYSQFVYGFFFLFESQVYRELLKLKEKSENPQSLNMNLLELVARYFIYRYQKRKTIADKSFWDESPPDVISHKWVPGESADS